MGPRKSLAVRKKRIEVEASTERRSKRREDEGARQPTAQPLAPVISMQNRPVTTGRKIYFDFIDREHFKFGDLFRAQGWEKFCTLEEPVYPRLVRMFFENLRITTECLSSNVKGTLIVLDSKRLSNLLEMPTEGLCYLNLQNKLEGMKVILEDEDTVDIRNLQANRLSVEMRLLHNMVSRIFFPKTGRFDWVTEKDIAFIYYLVKGKPMNLPFMMLCQMKEAARKQRACLPYGMVFTLIFREFGIDCSGEDAKKLLHTDRYTESSLHRMGYQKIDGRWTKKTSDGTDSDDDDQEEAPQDAGVTAQHSSPQTPSAPAPPASTSAQASQSTVFTSEQLDQISTLIDSKIEQAKAEIFQKIDACFGDVSKKIDSGIDKLQRHQLGHFSLISMSTARIGEILRDMSARNAPPSPPVSSSAVAMSSNPIVDPIATSTQADPGPSTRTYRRSARRPPPPPAGPATRTRSQASHRSGSKGESADS